MLNDEQRHAIYQALKDQPAGQAFNADIGVQLPPAVELHPMPAEVANRVPQTKDYRYAVADNRVLLVDPINRVVVGVFPDAKASKPAKAAARHSLGSFALGSMVTAPPRTAGRPKLQTHKSPRSSSARLRLAARDRLCARLATLRATVVACRCPPVGV
jgi:hypothetical protein